MSSIDAAIIKALVEHIGGNPDEIPEGTIGGTIGGGGSSTLSFRYEPLDLTYEKAAGDTELYVNKIEPTMFVIGHTVLRLKRKNSDVIETYICVRHEMSYALSISADFAPIVNDNPFQPSTNESEHLEMLIDHCMDEEYLINIAVNVDHEQPSAETSTGLFQLVVEGEPDNVRTLRENYVKTEIIMNKLTCSLMACMHASDITMTDFKLYN